MLTGRYSTLTAQIGRRTLVLSVIAFVALIAAGFSALLVANTTAQNRVQDVGAEAAREVDLFLTSIEADLQAVADTFAESETVDQGLRAVLRRHDEVFEVRYIDPAGNVLAQRRRGAVLGDQFVTSQPWLETLQAGGTYVGTVNFEEFGVPFVDFAVPARSASGEFTGALVARLDLTALWQTVIGIRVGDEGYAYIVDENGQLLVFSDLELVRQGINIDSEFGLLPGEINETSLLDLDFFNINSYVGLTDEAVVGTSSSLETVSWYTIVEQPLADALEGYIPLFVALFVTLLVGIAVVFATSRFLRRRVANPLREILEGAQVLASGDLSYRIEQTEGAQELSDLSGTLNQMADELEQVNRTLEARVEARTRDLQLAVQVSEQISTLLDPDQLLPQVVELTADYFDLYYAHVYLVNEETRNLVMSAGVGEAGRVMRERGHRIPLDAPLSLVARAAREREPVIVADTRNEPGFLANPLLPATRSEAAIPLVVGKRVVGVLDVQSDQPGRFDEDLIAVLLSMSGQIAVAIQNASLFSAVDRTSRRELAVSSVTQAIQQATSIDEVLQVAVRELGQALQVPHAAIELQLGAAETEDPAPQPTTT